MFHSTLLGSSSSRERVVGPTCRVRVDRSWSRSPAGHPLRPYGLCAGVDGEAEHVRTRQIAKVRLVALQPAISRTEPSPSPAIGSCAGAFREAFAGQTRSGSQLVVLPDHGVPLARRASDGVRTQITIRDTKCHARPALNPKCEGESRAEVA